jgi:hypothetical protein
MGSRCIRVSRSHPAFASLVLGCSVSAALLAQETLRQASAPAKGTGLILGRVIDATTGQGIPRALVQLTPSAPAPARIGEVTESRPIAAPGLPNQLRVFTADDGRFVFRDLPAANYSILAMSPAHTAGAYGRVRPGGPTQMLTLSEGQKRGDAVIRVWRFGSISGTVVDEHGDAAVAVNVRCFRRVVAGGQWRLSSTGLDSSVVTDDRGVYRLSGLPAGEYVCGVSSNQTTTPLDVVDMSQAAQQSGNPNASDGYRAIINSGGTTFTGATGVRVGNHVFSSSNVSTMRGLPGPPMEDGRLMIYPPVYYPASPTTRQATPVVLKPGEDRAGVNLQLRPVPAVRISGRITGPSGPGAYLNVTLFPASLETVSDVQGEAGQTISDATGAFTFLGIPAGQYVARVKLYPRPAAGAAGLDMMSLWATVPIAATADVDGLTVTLAPGVRATGRVVFDGAKPPSAAETQRIAIRMQAADGRTSSPIAADGRVAPDLTFRTAGYAGGHYLLSALPTSLPAGWTLKSAMLNGRDISVDPVELSDGDLTGIVVTFTDKSTSLTGRVSGPPTDLAGAEVIVWPADSTAWRTIGVVARRWRQERVHEAGVFAFTGLPPGDYFVTTIGASFPNDPQDPRVLETLMKAAQRVTVPDGGSASVALNLRDR